jgi:hydroxyethylthiazole kinase-like uncharacterized protein yjeF
VTVHVVTAAESAARDQAAIAGGIPSRALMRAAGFAAAGQIMARFPDRLAGGVAIHAGAGNNGGDAWVVAGALGSAGVPVRVAEAGEPRTDDARAERAWTRGLSVGVEPPAGDEAIVVDGVLGTGARGEPRGEVAEALARIRAREGRGAIVALDLPSGMDADTGEGSWAPRADLTVTFGAVKRGLLLARERSGTIVAVDIGLGAASSRADSAPRLVDSRYVRSCVPAIPVDAHKGTRCKLAIVGGAEGMLGAALLAARAAHRSGIGMVRLHVAETNLAGVAPESAQTMSGTWPADDDAARAIADWADAVVIGPGLGRTDAASEVLRRVLEVWRGPVVLDADALNLCAGHPQALGALLAWRPALITPHPVEAARLLGIDPREVERARFTIGAELARLTRATVLLKGIPTVITAPDGTALVSATGTPALAAAGSGDVLAGLAGTLVAQMGDATAAGACSAWVHGRAAEIAEAGRARRGVTLDDVLDALPRAWEWPAATVYPVLAELPALVP